MNNESITNNTVTVDAKVFAGFVANAARLEMVRDMLLTSCTLCYRGTELRVNDDMVLTVLRAIDNEAVDQRWNELKEEYAKSEEGANE